MANSCFPTDATNAVVYEKIPVKYDIQSITKCVRTRHLDEPGSEQRVSNSGTEDE